MFGAIGGFKNSGVGREFGTYGLEAFLEPRAILERSQPAKSPAVDQTSSERTRIEAALCAK